MNDTMNIINEDNPISDATAEEQIETSNGTETKQEQEASTIPEKFQGKSAEDLIAMYSNLEQDHSRLGNELGENRKLVDKLLQTEHFPAPQKEPAQEQELDWDYEPDKAAKAMVEKEVAQVKDELKSMKQETALEKFKTKYPDFDTDSASSNFMDWVEASQYRMNLYAKNYNGIDLVAASELMDGYGDYKSLHTEANSENQEQAEAKRKEDLKAASMEKGATGGGSRKKMWSRSYIRHLRLNEPAKYRANYDEIQAAYNEDRVTK